VSDELRIALPADLVEEIAQRAAELVRAELEELPEWLTIEEAAERYRTTPGALRWRAQQGRLPGAVKDGGRWLIDRRALDSSLGATVPIQNETDGRAPLERPRPGTRR
jgi:Helix-turn-helix domain